MKKTDAAEPSLRWEKQSYRRYTSSLTALPLEVVRIGVAPHVGWIVGNVFGRLFHSDNPPTTMPAAQVRAERLAALYTANAHKLLHRLAGGAGR